MTETASRPFPRARKSPVPALRRVLIAPLVCLAVACSARAEEAPKAQQLQSLVERGFLRYFVVSGRVTLVGNRFVHPADAAKDEDPDERLSIGFDGGFPSLDYSRSTDREQISIQVSQGDRVSVRHASTGAGDSRAAEFRQVPDEPITLSVTQKGREARYRPEDLWHLLIVEPEVCREHLMPLLGLLKSDWDLMPTAAEVQQTLVRMVATQPAPDRARWDALIEQLGDSRFSQREAADRQLREWGRVALPYLARFQRDQLDAEQFYRIRRIVLWLSEDAFDSPDTPDRVASLLLGDPTIWLALWERGDEATRGAAARQLGALLGEPVPADRAPDAASFAEQVERLRARIHQDWPPAVEKVAP